MKNKSNRPPRSHLLALLATTAALTLIPAAFAQSTWNGGGTDANWSTSANWDNALASNFDTALIFGGTTQLTNTNDLTGGTATSLTFNSGAGAFVIGGNAITLTGSITNNSSNLQTINLALATTAVDTITLTTGGGNITLGGVISGTGGGITTAGAGTLTLNGANTYTGGTIIGAGTTVVIGNSSALGSTSGALTLSGNTSTLNLNGFNVTAGNFSATTATAVVTSSTAATLTVNYQNTANLYSGLSLTGAASLMINGTSGGTANPLGTGTIVNGTGSIGFQNQTNSIRVNSIATNLGTSGTLLFNGLGNITTTNNNISLGSANAIVVNGTGNSWGFQPGTNGSITTNGAWTGSGTITLTQGFSTPTFYFAGNMTGFAGTLILASSGTTTNDGVQYAFSDSTTGQIGAGSAIVTQQLSQGSANNNTIEWKGTGSQTVAFGDLNTTGSASYTSTGVNTLLNAVSGTTVTFQVGALNLNSTYGGNIVNGSGTTAIAKVGTGTWTLTGANTYTGGTNVIAGTLAYGASFTMSGANQISITGTGTAGTNYATITSTAGTLTLGGSLKINVSTALSSGQSFNLFQASGGSLSGDFTGVSIAGSYVASLTDNSGIWTGTADGLDFTFTDSTGVLAVASAIPEPSTYAALVALAALGCVLYRRRTLRG